MKTITRKFKQFEIPRIFEGEDRIPTIFETIGILFEMLDKGYCVLKSSLTIRDVSTQGKTRYRVWIWACFVGKKRVNDFSMYDKENNKFHKYSRKTVGEEIIDFALSDEGKATVKAKKGYW